MKSIFYYTRMLILCVLFISCSSKTELNNKDLVSKNNKVMPNDKYIIDIKMENDTLEKRPQKGELIFFYKLNDTIKVTAKDSRVIVAYIALVSKIEIKKRPKPIKLPFKELEFTPINPNDTIRIPFKITPSFSGKARLVVVLGDDYYLYAYHSKEGKIRYKSYDYTLEKEVFIK